MGPTTPILAEHRERFAAMEELGCLISRVFFCRPETPGTVHHLVEGGRRIGHHATIYLAPWYHLGQPPQVKRGGVVRQLTVEEATHTYGPSLYHDRRAFERRFGTEQQLLADQDELIAMWLKCTGATPSTPPVLEEIRR